VPQTVQKHWKEADRCAKIRQQWTWEKMERMAHNGSWLRQPGATFLC